MKICNMLDFADGSVVNNLPANARETGDRGSILRSGRFPGVGNGSPCQYSCLENSQDRGAWWTLDLEVANHCPRLCHTHTDNMLSIISFSQNKTRRDTIIHLHLRKAEM